MDDTINVCLSCDDGYAKYAGVVIASVLKNANTSDDLKFFVLDGGISNGHKTQILELKSIKNCEISFVPINEEMFSEYKKVKTHDYVSLATYYRLKLASLLPDIKRVIYFDCDFIINSSLKELYDTQMGDCDIAGVLDINRKMVKKNPTYVNAGMLIFDLANIRKQNLEQRFLDWTKEHINTIKTGDQEIINEVLKGKIKIVPNEWNVQSSNFTNRSSYTNNPRAVHFVAKKKPWHFASFSYHRPLYFKYLQLTPWKLSNEEYRHWTTDNQIASLFSYLKYRPLFLLRPRFYKAFYSTYLKNFAEKIFSVKNHDRTHKLITLFGLKIKFLKNFQYFQDENIHLLKLGLMFVHKKV